MEVPQSQLANVGKVALVMFDLMMRAVNRSSAVSSEVSRRRVNVHFKLSKRHRNFKTGIYEHNYGAFGYPGWMY